MRGGKQGWAELGASQALGGLVMYTGYSLHERGIVTGPDGNPPWSIRTGENSYIDYRRLGGPLGVTLGLGALAASYMDAAETDQEFDVATGLFQAFSGGIGAIMNETSVMGILEFMDGIERDGDAARWLKAKDDFLVRTADNFVPYQALTNYMRERINDGERYFPSRARGGTYGPDEDMAEWGSELLSRTWEQWKGRFFWLDNDRYPKRNLFGEPMNRADMTDLALPGDVTARTGHTIKSWLIPRAYHLAKTDDLSRAIQRLQPELRFPRRSMVQSVRGYTDAIEYTAEQYDYVAAEAGKLFKQMGDRIVAGGYNDGVTKMLLENARNKSLKAARQMVLREFPELQARRRESMMRAVNKMRTDLGG